MREELKLIRNKQESIATAQSESGVTRDPLSFQNRPMEAPSQVDQLWDLLDKKPENLFSEGERGPDTFVPSDQTAFSPIKNRPSSAFQLTASSQSAVANASLGIPISIASANQIPSFSQSQMNRNMFASINQSIPSLDPLSSLHTHTVPAVSHPSMVHMQYSQPSMVPQHTQFPTNISQVSTPLPQMQQLLQPSLAPQSLQHTPTAQYNPHNIIHPQTKILIPQNIQPTNQYPPNPQIPIQSNIQSNPQIPIQPNIQSNPQIPIQSNIQSNPQIPIQSAVQSNPQIPIQPAVQSNVPLNPQQHAYLQQLQKQLMTSSPPSLTPDQLIVFQKQMLFLSQHPPQ